MKFSGKTALITGSGRGIGFGCALELARGGARVVINDRPGSPDLADAKKQLEALGAICISIEADVFSRAGCEALLAAALAEVPRIDILISNPAWNRRKAFLEYEPADFDRTIQGTLTAGFHMSQLVARQMIANKLAARDEARGVSGCQGKIVFISSVHAEMPYGLSSAYNAAKAGLNHLALTISAELNAHRINVNLIEPGWIDTPNERAVFGLDKMNEVAPTIPWGRLGQPADIGRAAAFLASEDADYITGATLRIDGGFVLKECRGDSIPTRKE
ncbi:MAG: SDR family oxidoreductase [Planctomycetia bacterium]|nr:SDR family oxidoreductase [Planctomycetia bacterium]